MNRFALNRRTGIAIAAAVGAAALAGYWWQGRAAEAVPLSELSRTTHIHGLAVDRQDPSALILATHHGVWRLEDGTARLISDNRNDYMGFSPHPADPGRFFASGHPEGGGNMGVIASEDGGSTWKQLAEGARGPVDFHAMDVSAADPDVLYGLYGGVQASEDGGRSWEMRGAPPADTFALAASATDADTVYAATREGLMVSRDGARTWQPAHSVRQPASLVETTPEGAVYAFVVGEGLIRAREPELRWEAVSNDFGERIPLHLAVDPTDPARLYAATQHGEILASADGGRSWSALGQ